MNIQYLEFFYHFARCRGVRAVRKRVPDFHFSLASGRIEKIEGHLRSEKIDLGLLTSQGFHPCKIQAHEPLRMPVVLLVSENGGPLTAAEILDLDRIELPLVTQPRNECGAGVI